MAIPGGGLARVNVTHSATLYAANVDGDPTYTTYPQCTFLQQDHDNLFVKQKQTTANDGNLVVTRRPPKSGGGWSFGDRMLLEVFGHGASFSVNANVSAPSGYAVWIECDADAAGRGQAIAHFFYQPGSTPIYNSDVTPLYQLGKDASGNPIAQDVTCCARYDTGVLVVRYHLAANPSQFYYQGWPISAAEANDFSSPYLSSPAPEPAHQLNGTFNGWTFYGQYLYMITGDAADVVGTDNVYLYSMDLNNPSSVVSNPKTVDYSNPGGQIRPREPEGVMIDSTGGSVRVVFGLTNSATGKDVNLYYVS